jgi:hypothetical protein
MTTTLEKRVSIFKKLDKYLSRSEKKEIKDQQSILNRLSKKRPPSAKDRQDAADAVDKIAIILENKNKEIWAKDPSLAYDVSRIIPDLFKGATQIRDKGAEIPNGSLESILSSNVGKELEKDNGKDSANVGRAANNDLSTNCQQVYSKALTSASKNLTLTDDQRVAKTLTSAGFDIATITAVIENGSPNANTMEKSAKNKYAEGVAKAAEINSKNEMEKPDLAHTASRGAEY